MDPLPSPLRSHTTVDKVECIVRSRYVHEPFRGQRLDVLQFRSTLIEVRRTVALRRDNQTNRSERFVSLSRRHHTRCLQNRTKRLRSTTILFCDDTTHTRLCVCNRRNPPRERPHRSEGRRRARQREPRGDSIPTDDRSIDRWRLTSFDLSSGPPEGTRRARRRVAPRRAALPRAARDAHAARDGRRRLCACAQAALPL